MHRFFLAVGILAQVAAVALAGRFDHPRVAPDVSLHYAALLPDAVAVAGDLCIVAAGLVVAAAPRTEARRAEARGWFIALGVLALAGAGLAGVPRDTGNGGRLVATGVLALACGSFFLAAGVIAYGAGPGAGEPGVNGVEVPAWVEIGVRE